MDCSGVWTDLYVYGKGGGERTNGTRASVQKSTSKHQSRPLNGNVILLSISSNRSDEERDWVP